MVNLKGKSIKYLRLPTTNYTTQSNAVISAQEGDKNSRFVCVSLFDDAGNISLSGYASATLYATLPDGSLQKSTATIDPYEDVIVCKIPRSMLCKVGKVHCNVELSAPKGEDQEETTLTSQTFCIQVFASQAGDETLEGNDKEGLIQRLQKELADVRAALAKRVTGKSFEDYAELIETLNSSTEEDFSVGQHFFIKTLNVPDVWVYGITDEYNVYEYMDDESFATTVVNELAHVGHYILSALETQKVDLTDYVKNTDYANSSKAGAVKVTGSNGIYIGDAGNIGINRASKTQITNKTEVYNPIVPSVLDYAVKVGLTANTETLTDDEKAAALEWLGALPKYSQGGAVRFYGINRNGAQTTYLGADTDLTFQSGRVAMYVNDANSASKEPAAALNTKIPVKDYQCAPKKYVDDTCVPKLTEGNGVYIHQGETQKHISYGYSANPYTIAYRDDKGNFQVNVPVNETDCANKKYVDDSIAGATKLYLHTIAFDQRISSPEGEPFSNVYLFVITTDPTPAVINIDGHYGSCGDLSLKFAPSQILAAYGGWDMDINGGKFNLPVELCISHPIPGAGFVNSTFIDQAVIPAVEARCGRFEGYSTSEVVLDHTKFIGDTVTEI